MEPRFFKRGNFAYRSLAVEQADGFNGATFFQTWKYDGQGRSYLAFASFNGATFFQTWKCSSPAFSLTRPTTLQWSHVFSNVEMLHKKGESWKFGNLLQWSHVFSNVEMTGELRIVLQNVMASMEPRFFKRGNESCRAG